MRFYFWSDPRGVGAAICTRAESRGHDVWYASRPKRIDAAYVRRVNYGAHSETAAIVHSQLLDDGVPCVPSELDGMLYDSKLAQQKLLDRWLPETRVYRSRETARVGDHGFPLVTKTSHGSASKNVHLIEDEQDLANAMTVIFGPGGDGYLYVQQFIPNNPHDIRVVICGDRLFGLTRFNRERVPFASGSGKNAPITSLSDPWVRQAFEMALEIADSIGTRWAAMDFVHDETRTYVLEISCAWTEPAYVNCPTFNRQLEPDGGTAASWADFAVDEMERIAR